MKKLLGQASASAVVFALSALPVLAGGGRGHGGGGRGHGNGNGFGNGHGHGHGHGHGGGRHDVPEIDASTGLLALAAILAAVAFAWELRRRRQLA